MADDSQSIIEKSKGLLKDIIEVYSDIYSKGEDLGILNDKDINIDSALSTFRDIYNSTFNFLKASGTDVSAFPKSLEDLAKKDGE